MILQMNNTISTVLQRCAILLMGAGLAVSRSGAGEVSFNRDVRPILAANCYSCHGPDASSREADLRLDSFKDSTVDLGGYKAIQPGNAGSSEIIARIESTDPDDVMPPPKTGHKITADQLAILKQWINEGADYEEHWSFVPVTRPTLPEIETSDWPRNGIDFFVASRLEDAGLRPTPEADRYTLIRRLYIDLIGLPPSWEEVEKFVHDPDPRAYENLVDSLLDNPAYGEKWAAMWLDLARYADSAGYGSDPLRTIWKYRDWVIEAFNRNLPYDRFTIEQIAGDLLENPTPDQNIATAFHRNTKTNTEGGTDDEEFRTEAVRDRVDTTMQVWMGVTMGCAKCHTHKYDPISITEYYQFYDFFNQTADEDRPNEEPRFATPTPGQQQQLDRLDHRIAELRRVTSTIDAGLQTEFDAWKTSVRTPPEITGLTLSEWYQAGPFTAENFDKAHSTDFVDASKVDPSKPVTYGEKDYEWTLRPEFGDGVVHNLSGDNSATYLFRTISSEEDAYRFVSLGSDDSVQLWFNGKRLHNNKITRGVSPDQDYVGLPLEKGSNQLLLKIANGNGGYGFYFDIKERNAPDDIVELLLKDESTLQEDEQGKIKSFFLDNTPSLRKERAELASVESRRRNLQNSVVTTPVMQELPDDKKRQSHILLKGNFLSKGDPVEAGVPSAFHDWPENAPKNRLGLAHWLVDDENPLTARVAVNRFWSRLFGRGLVETEEDFGMQGKMPTHPRLLDSMAWTFQHEMDWNIKKFIRLLVTSSTYRQDSRVDEQSAKVDPRNELYWRMSRIRLSAELIRDQGLSVSGLLSHKQLGPSVFPPQPDGLWRAAFNGQRNWATSEGEDRYRRGIYTFLRRTIPYPSMATFDAPSREICTLRRLPTNTPLQAFVTMNDPAFVEMSQAFAARIQKEGGSTLEDRIRFALRAALSRPPSDEQVQILVELFQSEKDFYTGNEQEAAKLLGRFAEWMPGDASAAENAAWVVLANVILNLDGFLMKG